MESNTSSFQHLTRSFRAIGESQGDDFVVFGKFDLSGLLACGGAVQLDVELNRGRLPPYIFKDDKRAVNTTDGVVGNPRDHRVG